MQMEAYSFQIEYNKIDMKRFVKRFHFEERDMELLAAAERFLAELVLVESVMVYREEKVVCAVTLGERFDFLSELVMDRENLLLAYGMECLGMEFLSCAYEKISAHVFERTGKWIGNYHFLEGEELEAGVDLAKMPVVWENGMLHPLKSAVFTAEYVESREEGKCGQCESCENAACSFRISTEKNAERESGKYAEYRERLKRGEYPVYSYGISRILKER